MSLNLLTTSKRWNIGLHYVTCVSDDIRMSGTVAGRWANQVEKVGDNRRRTLQTAYSPFATVDYQQRLMYINV